MNPALVGELIKELEITENDVFYDLGSGVGNVVLQVCNLHTFHSPPHLFLEAVTFVYEENFNNS